MRLLGFTFREWFRIGFAAATFFLAAKWLAPKANVPALTQTVDKL